jgi:hypothetical protein
MEDLGDFMESEQLEVELAIQNSQEPKSLDLNQKKYDKELYKKWFRSKTQSGFISIKPWYEGLKFKIDIGRTSNEGKLDSNTTVYVDVVDFAAYLKSVTNGTATINYPANPKMGLTHPESFVAYGGGIIDNKPISRIFKSQYWQSGDTIDTGSFVWKCGHFQARKSESGAFIPDMKSPLSVDSIKITRQDAVSISYLLDLSLISHVSNNPRWYEV